MDPNHLRICLEIVGETPCSPASAEVSFSIGQAEWGRESEMRTVRMSSRMVVR
jgi:hypothetical protein